MRPSVFVGREAAPAVLAELAERARVNQPQAALIDGEAGIGKSSLLAQAREQVEGRVLGT